MALLLPVVIIFGFLGLFIAFVRRRWLAFMKKHNITQQEISSIV